MAQSCIFHDHSIGKEEGALELPGGNASVQELPPRLILLLSANIELVVFTHHFEFGFGKSGNRDGNDEAFRAVFADGALDIVRG